MKKLLTLATALSLASCSRGAPDANATAQATPQLLLDREVTLTPGQPSALEIPVDANADLIVTVTSTAFDPVLEVVPPGAEPLHNDDFQGSRTQSQLTLHPTQPGPMRLAVTSFTQGGGGSYRVTVRKVPTVTNLGSFLVPGATEAGQVTTGDRVLPDGRAYDEFMVLGPAAGAAYELRLTARGQVVPLAVVLDPRGRAIAATTPGVYVIREPFLHRVQLIAPSAGTDAAYSIALVTQGGPTPGGAGAQPAPAAPAIAARPGAAAATNPAGVVANAPSPALIRDQHALPPMLTGRSIPGVGNYEASLGASRFLLPSGENAEVFELDVAAGSSMVFDATSDEFDTYLLAVGPDGRIEENDDTTGTNAHLEMTFAVAGRAKLVVTSYQRGMRGRFVLKVGNGTGGATTANVAPSGDAHPSVGGARTLRGELARGDATLQSGEFIDTYRETFQAGEHIRVRVSSNAFDSYLIVRSPSGQQSDNDDYAPPDRGAGIDIPAAEAGEYSIAVTSYQADERGRYELQIERSGGGSGAGANGPTNDVREQDRGGTVPVANPSTPGAPRLFGIFVGISDYPEGVGDLAECANDATKLAEALRNRGLQRPETQVVLTDRQATTAGLRDAFQRVAASMGPDDTFVFFYSGHGAQREGSRDSREIDGTDETIVLQDGHLLDDEMGRLFDGLRARTAVLALDSCFAGGFAKDVITRPGRVGMFSSEEDVESTVASQFQAGGYLSYFLREGVTGAADIGPRDGVLTVGELQHFLTLQFGRHATDVELAGAYQHLVVDRGAVRSTEVLWRYP